MCVYICVYIYIYIYMYIYISLWYCCTFNESYSVWVLMEMCHKCCWYIFNTRWTVASVCWSGLAKSAARDVNISTSPCLAMCVVCVCVCVWCVCGVCVCLVTSWWLTGCSICTLGLVCLPISLYNLCVWNPRQILSTRPSQYSPAQPNRPIWQHCSPRHPSHWPDRSTRSNRSLSSTQICPLCLSLARWTQSPEQLCPWGAAAVVASVQVEADGVVSAGAAARSALVHVCRRN